MAHIFGGREVVPLVDLLHATASVDSCEAFFHQLLWHTSVLVERKLFALTKEDWGDTGLACKWIDVEDDETVTDISRRVCEYTMCGVEQFGYPLRSLGASTDKGWAKSHPIMCTQFFSGTHAVQAAPQVPWGGFPGRAVPTIRERVSQMSSDHGVDGIVLM